MTTTGRRFRRGDRVRYAPAGKVEADGDLYGNIVRCKIVGLPRKNSSFSGFINEVDFIPTEIVKAA
jgi:hypothetical protein